MSKPWPKTPAPTELLTGFVTDETVETPMLTRGPSGAAPSWNGPRVTRTECKHGEGPCETCGTTNRRDTPHKTKGGLGVVGRLRKR